MTRDEMDEWADQKRDEIIDDRLTRNVCVHCEGPMPPNPLRARPANCPMCRPHHWEEFHTYVGPGYNWQVFIGEQVFSPIGEGVLTGVSDRGYPKVNGVAVTWAQFLNWRIHDG